MTGQTLGHYKILEKLGEGGMGVVYRAIDTRLDRVVAIKVLSSEATADPERKKRFVQEAKAASALNHPNIITVYDIGSDGGVDYMAMEFVAGQTLDSRLGGKALPLREALKYAVEIADALSRAHAAGIVHRDLKPGNVMLTEEDRVKVLDFGLAKLTETADSDPLGPTATFTQPARTQEGAILGTIAYMSPEQAEGKKVDPRSDVFSFGSVLYEMITGRPAFHGETRISTLAAILNKEPPPLAEVTPGIPRELEKILARCLKKDRRRRFQVMEDVKLALEEVDLEPSPAVAPAVASRARPWGLLLAVAVAAIAIGLVIGRWMPSAGPADGPVLTRLTSDAGLTSEPALSPDGKLLAYASDRAGEGNLDIWVQQLAGGEPVRLTRDAADEHEPSFSPDGSRIAFRAEKEGGGIYVVSALGGEPRKIAELGRTPRFSPDGAQVAYWVGSFIDGPGQGKIYVVPSDGGPPRQIQPGFSLARWPLWSPDGKRLLFYGAQEAAQSFTTEWWIANLEGGEAVTAGARAMLPGQEIMTAFRRPLYPSAWTADDRLLFAAHTGDSTNLWQIRIGSDGKVSGAAERVTQGAGLEMNPAADAAGRIAFSTLTENIDLWSLPVDGNKGQALGPLQRVTSSAAAEIYPSLSPDGKKVVFYTSQSRGLDLRLLDLATAKESAVIASVKGRGNFSRFLRGGSQLAYASQEDRSVVAYVVPIDRNGQPGVAQKVCPNCGLNIWDFSPDGKKLLQSSPANETLVMWDVDAGRSTTLLNRPGEVLARAQFSPDDRWIAMHYRKGPQSRVIVIPARDGPIPDSEVIAVTDGSALDVVVAWSSDGQLIYFFSNRDGALCVWAQRLDATKHPSGAPFVVQHFHQPRLSPANMPTQWLGMAIAKDKLFLALGETTGNIWLASWDRTARH